MKKKYPWWKEPVAYIAECPAWPHKEKKWQLSAKADLAIILIPAALVVAGVILAKVLN